MKILKYNKKIEKHILLAGDVLTLKAVTNCEVIIITKQIKPIGK